MRRNFISATILLAVLLSGSSRAIAQTLFSPAGKAYSIQTKNSSLTAEYKYAPPIPSGSGGSCGSRYFSNVALRNLCEEIESLKAQACKQTPGLSFCINL